MLRPLRLLPTLAALVACAPAQSPQAPVLERSTAPATTRAAGPTRANTAPESKKDLGTPEAAARTFFSSIFAGDRDGARAAAMTFDDMADRTKKISDRGAWDRELDAFIDKLMREVAGHEMKILTTKVTTRLSLHAADDPDRLKMDVEAAEVAVTFESEGQERGMPAFVFLQTRDGWKFSPKH